VFLVKILEVKRMAQVEPRVQQGFEHRNSKVPLENVEVSNAVGKADIMNREKISFLGILYHLPSLGGG
jgi:hypothetical protein